MNKLMTASIRLAANGSFPADVDTVKRSSTSAAGLVRAVNG